MAFIINIQKKKWLVNGFAIGTILLLFIGFIPGIYQSLKMKYRYVGVINGERIYQNTYEEKFKEVQSRYSNISDNEAHQKAWHEILRKKNLEGLAKELGITIPKEEVNLTIKSYTKLVQDLLETHGYNPTKALAEIKNNNGDKTMPDGDAWRLYLKTDNGKKFVRHYLRNKIELKLLEERVKGLLPNNSFQYHFHLDEHKATKNITYYTLQVSQVPVSDDEITPARKKQWWDEHQDCYNDTTATEVACLSYAVVPSSEQREEIATLLKSLKQGFREASQPKDYARQNADKAEIEKIWREDKASNEIKNLKEGEVSSVVWENNTASIYLRIPNQDSDTDLTIRCVCITKKIDVKEKREYVKKKVNYELDQIKKTSWEKWVKKHSMNPQTILVTPEIANITLGKDDAAAKIAQEVYAKNLYRGKYGIVETSSGYCIYAVQKKINNKNPQAHEKTIKSGAKNEIRLQKVNDTIKTHTLDGMLNRETFGKLTSKSKPINMNTNDIDGVVCDKHIPHILNLKVGDTPYVFEKEGKIFIVSVESEQEIDHNKILPEPSDKEFDHAKVIPPKDFRYSYNPEENN